VAEKGNVSRFAFRVSHFALRIPRFALRIPRFALRASLSMGGTYVGWVSNSISLDSHDHGVIEELARKAKHRLLKLTVYAKCVITYLYSSWRF